MIKTTEGDSQYDELEFMSTERLTLGMNEQDRTIADATATALPQINKLIDAAYMRMASGGRLFYLGAGTSGRLGVLDAAEIPPTFGLDDRIIGLIAGGDGAIRKAVERAEDNQDQAWKDLAVYSVTTLDFIIGISASGSTPYVLGGLSDASLAGVSTGCIVCNSPSAISSAADYPVEVVVGPEFITGSTRMKAGTAQKLVLNMISTTLMIKLGRVKGNRMVDMKMTNDKLIDRGARIISQETGLGINESIQLLKNHQSVRDALAYYNRS